MLSCVIFRPMTTFIVVRRFHDGLYTNFPSSCKQFWFFFHDSYDIALIPSGTRPMTGSMSRATTAQATNRVKSAPGQRGKRSPHPSVVVSTPDNSRPSTATTVRIHHSSLLRPSSAATPSRKGARSPDTSFKSRLSSWKEEI
jgi:hypothetical protein